MGLFEGIGGFSLAARWAGWQTPVMVEWNPYCQAVLKKNFPDATIFSDVRNFDGRPYAGQIDIITGGFPCQPFSHAGKRGGTNDDRYLWPEMLRVIREVKPAWVVGENVAGLLSMDGGRVFAGILADLENAGYSTEIYLIPAIGVGAPHRRDRVWIASCNNSARFNQVKQPGEHAGTAKRARVQSEFSSKNFNPPNADVSRLEKRKGVAGNNREKCAPAFGNFWREHWYEVATRICRVDDGIPGRLDGTGSVSTKTKKGKAQRLEGLGNAIISEIAYLIFHAINQTYASNI